MSCLVAIQFKQTLFFGTDTALSLMTDDNEIIRVPGKAEKIDKIGSKLIFSSGNTSLTEGIILEFKKSSNQSIEQLRRICIMGNQQFLNTAMFKNTRHFSVVVGTIENNQTVIYSIESSTGFQIVKHETKLDEINYITAGAKTKEAKELLNHYLVENYRNQSLFEIYQSVFNEVSFEGVGGNLLVYRLDQHGIRQVYKNPIKEKPNLQRINLSYKIEPLLLHNIRTNQLVAGSAKISTALIEDLEVGSNVRMGAGASITWSQVTSQPNAAALGGLMANSPILTHIDSKGVYTGVLSADQINAGKISAQFIDTTNLSAQRVYQKDYPGNYVKVGGQFGDLELYYNGSKYFSIYNGLDHVSLLSYGSECLSFSNATKATYVKGLWDFSGATVTGLTAKFA
ncbi:hypothetical protein [Paenibacillus chitinolyticus]|uniref:hypothetical protein n=1 Tax=Paenibacillus chitinolyticus TaxID=79263 RepID=UPI003656BB1A